MKLFLNNIFKGLLTAFVVICLGGFIALNINVTPSNVMVLVSSSLINSINTDVLEKEELKEDAIIDDDKEEKEEIKEEVKEVTEPVVEVVTPEPAPVPVPEPEPAPTPVPAPQPTPPPAKQEVVVQGSYQPNLAVASTIEPIATYYGKMTGYGPDCYGCSGITASGKNVLNGNIYYQDKTFGNIRIVAGDRSIPFGSIIRISGTTISTEPILAIVLDRGGMIGFQEGKHSYFDLLYETERAATVVGMQNATFELLRSGY